MITLLKGKKTYLVAALMAVLNFAVAVNWITADKLTAINFVLTALGLSALRAGVTKPGLNQ